MKEKIDFFTPKCSVFNITTKKFGICDGENESPAFVDQEHEDSWVAIVNNETDDPLIFTAIDHCVDFPRSKEEMDNRCDAILRGSNHLIFIELKDQRADWIQKAVNSQLQTTIDYFKENHDLTKFQKRKAYVCNRAHPQFKFSHKELMQNFRNRNGIRLYIENRIVIK